ncbi:site-specific integrase, partial [Escherichia coli]|nr:site-specific integrase [Escherichia coli]HAI2327849.1 site-specific integrase [Escherichia coli]HBK1501176.1 site-specific integrase [Escherichia coli]
MEIKPNTLLLQGSGMYDQNLSSKLKSLVIPGIIFLKSCSDFDDKHIHNEGDEWLFYYSGSKRYVYFKLDELTNTLLKYFCFKYASTMFPTALPILSHHWTQAFSYCRGNGGFTLLILRQYIESNDLDARAFYSILFGLKILCSEEFSGFTLEDYEDLEFIPRPNAYNWEIYQDIDNLLELFAKNMISKGLFEMATALARGKSYDIRELKHAAILGLSYVTGARPVQLAKLAVRDLRIDTCNTNTGLIRYSILLPYVKQRRLTTERLLLAIPPEIGALIKHYVDRAQLLSNDKM